MFPDHNQTVKFTIPVSLSSEQPFSDRHSINADTFQYSEFIQNKTIPGFHNVYQKSVQAC